MSAISEVSNKPRNGKYMRESFPVLEMTCAACAISVESMLKATAGVKDAGVNFANQTAWVEYDQKVTKPFDLRNSVRAIGYDLVVDVEDPQAVQQEAQRKHYESVKRRTIWSSILAVPLVIIGMFFMDMPYGTYISMVLAAPVVFYFGRNFFINAWKQAKYGKANMDTLVALSTGIAFLFSAFKTFFTEFWHSRGIHAHVYYEAAAVVVAFISLGKLLEEKAKSNTSSAIKKLMGLQPKTVRVVIEGVESEHEAQVEARRVEEAPRTVTYAPRRTCCATPRLRATALAARGRGATWGHRAWSRAAGSPWPHSSTNLLTIPPSQDLEPC